MSTNDHYNINSPGTDRFKGLRQKICFHHSKAHWCIVDQNLLAQVKNPSRVKIYSWWNTVIKSGKMLFLYLSTESTILPPGTKTFNIKFFFFWGGESSDRG